MTSLLMNHHDVQTRLKKRRVRLFLSIPPLYDLEAFKKSWKRIPTSVQDKLKRAKADGGYGLDINYLKSFFSGANHFQRRSRTFSSSS